MFVPIEDLIQISICYPLIVGAFPNKTQLFIIVPQALIWPSVRYGHDSSLYRMRSYHMISTKISKIPLEIKYF